MTLFQAVIDKLVALELLHRTGGDLHLPDHRHEASPEENCFSRKIQPLLAQAGRIPPRTHELVDSTGMPLKQIEAILKQACRSGRLIKVADNRHFLPETLDDLARFTRQLADQQTDGGFFCNPVSRCFRHRPKSVHRNTGTLRPGGAYPAG